MVLLLTPLPSIASIALLDCISLQSPSTGLHKSHCFWLRAFATTWLMEFAVLELLRRIVLHIPTTTIEIAATATVVTAPAIAVSVAQAHYIGFPVPFTIALNTPVTFAVFAACFALRWENVLRELCHCVVLFFKQTALVCIYSAYAYEVVFHMVKHWIGKSMPKNTSVEDLKPEVVTFNAEIFHVLYTSIHMQNSTSKLIVALFTTVDVLYACVSLHHVQAHVQTITRLWTQPTALLPTTRRRCRRHQHPKGQQSSTVVPLDDSPNVYTSKMSLVNIVQYILENDPHVCEHSSIRLQTHVKAAAPTTSVVSVYALSSITPGNSRQMKAVHISTEEKRIAEELSTSMRCALKLSIRYSNCCT
uniref:Uncharacterized protein n=1 Tax=Globisporangium ultimum (strain ATCC 200006 / CBS 805.95 / DAOM BR144) TaxID=431595 RepID=K3X8G4_GLOUD